MNKTHYEAAYAYLKNTIEIDEFVHKGRITHPGGMDFAELQIAIKEMWPRVQTLPIKIFAYYSNVLFHLYQMKYHEEKVYVVTQQLAQQLADTSLNVNCRYLKSPFKEIFIQIDKGLFQIFDVQTLKEVDVEGIYVYLNEDGIHREIRIMAASLLKSNEQYPFNDSIFYFRFYMDEGDKIKDKVDKYLEDPAIWSNINTKKCDGGINKKYIATLSNFVFNTLLYVTSKDADIQAMLPFRPTGLKKARKQKKEQAKIARTSALPYILVGGNVKQSCEQVVSISKWKLQHRVYVEGYWRIQWYGSIKNDTRNAQTIWIAPYHKGPELAEVINKVHLINHPAHKGRGFKPESLSR